jgi:hypothetical protein
LHASAGVPRIPAAMAQDFVSSSPAVFVQPVVVDVVYGSDSSSRRQHTAEDSPQQHAAREPMHADQHPDHAAREPRHAEERPDHADRGRGSSSNLRQHTAEDSPPQHADRVPMHAEQRIDHADRGRDRDDGAGWRGSDATATRRRSLLASTPEREYEVDPEDAQVGDGRRSGDCRGL